MSYAVFYLLRSNGSGWGFHSSGHHTVEAAERAAVDCMRIHGDNINTIRVVQLIYEGKPRETTTVTWK